MKILLFGNIGQVGSALYPLLAALGDVTAPSPEAGDFTKPESIRRLVATVEPDLIVNAAAYTAVDQAEADPDTAELINAAAPALLASEAARLGALMVHYSTDFVFDGQKASPYSEKDTPNPLSVYARTKWAGDQAVANAGGHHLIFRLSWVYGLTGKNFLLTIRTLAAQGKALRIVDDQTGAPTWSGSIAQGTQQALRQVVGPDPTLSLDDVSGIYHMVCGGATSWYGFARAFLPNDAPISPVPTEAYPTPATRPAYSVLDCSHLRDTFGVQLPSWQNALAECLASGAQPA